MGVEKDNIKDLFSAKLGGNFEPEVPASVWAGIDQLLPNLAVPAPDASSSVSSSSSSSGTTATSSAGSTTASSSVSVLKIAAITTGIAASVATGVLVIQNKDSLPEQTIGIQPVVETTIDSLMIEEYSPDSIYEFIPLPARRPVIAEAVEEVPSVSDIVEEETVKEEAKKTPKKERVESLIASQDDLLEQPPVKKSITNGLSVGLMARADVLSGDMNQSSSAFLMSPQSYTKYFNAIDNNLNRDYKLEHSQPISIGLSIEKQITSNVSVGTGLVYTYLSSTGRSSGVYVVDEKQVFHYLGIPLSVNYTFYQLKNAKFYLSAGGMVQKDIQGRYTGQINMLYSQVDQNIGLLERIGGVDLNAVSTVDGMSVLKLGSSKNKISQDNLQFSARLTVGASWPIYRKVSLYGTVGGAYYFDAGNKYKTIYSDQKTQLDLNIGLKIDF